MRNVFDRNIKVCSPEVDTYYFDIVAGVLQGDTLAPYLFIICLDYVLRTSIDKNKENGFKLTKQRSRRYPAKIIIDTNYADDIALLANTRTLLHSLERSAAGIGPHINAHKTEYMCFNQIGDISTLNSSPLKLVDKFTDLGSSVSSIETDINARRAKALAAIDRLLVIWKSDLTDKIKRSFFQAAVMSILQRLQVNGWRKSLRANTKECCEQYWTPEKQQLYGRLPPIMKTIKIDESDMRDTAGEVGTSS